jgi:succinate dehydrogenase/fumarate reductase flavoprotein subunit
MKKIGLTLKSIFGRVSVKQCLKALKQSMWNQAGVIRRKSGLVEALAHLRESLPRIAVSSPTEIIRRLELENMRCVAKMVCRGALERAESRGSHFRSDYPEENNQNWIKYYFKQKRDRYQS